MPEEVKDIQSEVKDINNDSKIDKSEFLDGLSKLESKDIAESLNNPDKKEIITNLVKTSVEEAIKDLKDKKFEDLNGDEKDLLVLNSRLSLNNQESFNALIKQDKSLDQTMYESIAQTEFNRLYPAQQEETPESGEGDIDKIELDNISNLHLYGARTKYVTLPSKEDIVSAVNAIPEDKKYLRTTIATALKNSSKFEEDGDIYSSKEEIKKIQTELAKENVVLYGNNGGIDGMFGLGTYRGILNLSKEEKEDANLADIEDISITENLNDVDRIETLEDGSLRIGDKKNSILLTPDGDFYKRDGYLGKYELKGDKLYYLGKDFALQSFDGKSWKYERNERNEISNIDLKLKNEIKNIIDIQKDDETLITTIKDRDLDYNGVNSSDDAGEKYLIKNIFKKASEKNAILTPLLLNGLKNYLIKKSLIDSNNNIDYGNPSYTQRTKDNDKVEKEIDNYMEKIAINIV